MKKLTLAAVAVMAFSTLSFGAAYKDIIGDGGWEGGIDELKSGSRVDLTIDSTDDGAYNKIVAKIVKGKGDDAYSFTAVYFEDTTNFDGCETVVITYKADKQVWISFPMNGITDGDTAAHGCVLDPTGDTLKTDTIALTDSTVQQPGWWFGDNPKADTLKFDASKVTSISFEQEDPAADGDSVNLEIDTLLADGITWGEETSPITTLASASKAANLVKGISTKGVELSVPATGTYSVSLYSANGRMLQTKSVSLEASKEGRNVAFNITSKGMYIVSVKGNGINSTEKVSLK